VCIRRWPDPPVALREVVVLLSCPRPRRKSTCPKALSLSFTAIAAAPYITPHDRGGSSTNAAASAESISK